MEVDSFRKIFPGMPLTGFLGEGQIGLDVLPNVSVEDKNGAYQYSRSTVFVVLSFD